MRSPILFLIFNRPDTTRQVFEAIRSARPPRLYIAADGPRKDRINEDKRCAEVRSIATAIDWPCEIHTLFRDQNLGCKLSVSSGIDWFFQQEPEGIILEDDVLPLPSFFTYCDELLEHYRNNAQIGMISGCNLITKYTNINESYFFSKHNHIWGWASWRRAWSHYDVAMSSWLEWKNTKNLTSIDSGNRLFKIYWQNIFDKCYAGEIDTWDYQWTFALWKNNMLSILPTHNQTYNLGFGIDATHTTTNIPSYVVDSIPEALEFPLVHPNNVNSTYAIDNLIDRKIYGISLFTIIKKIFISTPYTFMLKKIKIWIH